MNNAPWWWSVLAAVALGACTSGGVVAAEAPPTVVKSAVSCPVNGRAPMGFALYPGRLMALASGRKRVAPYLQTVTARADFLSFHWDNNVPWALLAACESDLDRCDPPRRLRKSHERQQAFFDDALMTMSAPGVKRFVAINPLDIQRKGVSVSFESQQGVRNAGAPGQDRADPDVRRLYLDFVRYAVTKFRPAYFSPGIEINMYAAERPDDFDNLLSLMDEAHAVVRELDPSIVVAPSIQWEFFKRDWENASVRPHLDTLVGAMLRLADGLFFSTYPTIFGTRGNVAPEDYAFDAYGLGTNGVPVLVAEAGTQPPLQTSLITTLVGLSARHDLHGVVWFLAQDMDRLNIPVPGLRNIGLFDDARKTLRAHPGAGVWDSFFACPAAP
jgi:hypothetical protein